MSRCEGISFSESYYHSIGGSVLSKSRVHFCHATEGFMADTVLPENVLHACSVHRVCALKRSS